MEIATKQFRYGLIIDDQPLFARGLTELLLAHNVVNTTLIATSAEECFALIAQHGKPIITIADFWLAAVSNTSFISVLKAKYALTKILMTSADADPAVANMAREYANGFLKKQATNDIFLKAVRSVIAGDDWHASNSHMLSHTQHRRDIPITADALGLSPRQAQILMIVLEGQPNKRIAQELGVTESTIKEHITGILQKLSVSNRVEAITKLRGHRLVMH